MLGSRGHGTRSYRRNERGGVGAAIGVAIVVLLLVAWALGWLARFGIPSP